MNRASQIRLNCKQKNDVHKPITRLYPEPAAYIHPLILGYRSAGNFLFFLGWLFFIITFGRNFKERVR